MYLYYFFAAIVVFLGYKSWRSGIDYLDFFKRELARPRSAFTPFASVFVPCRGLDWHLRENLAALFRQDYPDYELIFVVDDERDAAVPVIRHLIADETAKRPDGRPAARLIIAGKAEAEGQKVHNLRQAVSAVSPKSDVLVFVDSDARPAPAWLGNLVAPLEDDRIGAATGYRWFIADRGGFSTELRAVWNASIASALGANTKSNFCWGGSTAIRARTFEKLEMRRRLKGTLSDDFTFTRVLKEAAMPVRFVPHCLTATVEDCTFGELLEFTTRQMKITRVYAAHLWKASFIGSVLFTGTFWSGIVLLFFISGRHFWLTLTLLLLIFTLGVLKARLRLKSVKLVLPDYRRELDRSSPWQFLLWTITPALYLYNCFSALVSNEISWRGIRYALKSPNETVITRSGDPR